MRTTVAYIYGVLKWLGRNSKAYRYYSMVSVHIFRVLRGSVTKRYFHGFFPWQCIPGTLRWFEKSCDKHDLSRIALRIAYPEGFGKKLQSPWVFIYGFGTHLHKLTRYVNSAYGCTRIQFEQMCIKTCLFTQKKSPTSIRICTEYE